jgi:hypothetical protein
MLKSNVFIVISGLFFSLTGMAGTLAIGHGLDSDGSPSLNFDYGPTAVMDALNTCEANFASCSVEGPYTDASAHVFFYNTKTKKVYSGISDDPYSAIVSAATECVKASAQTDCQGSPVIVSALNDPGVVADTGGNVSQASGGGSPGYNYYTWAQNCNSNGICDTSGNYTYHWAPACDADGRCYTDH